MSEFIGGCQCGAVRYQVTGDPVFSAVCHCPSCRKSVGAPLVGWSMFQQSDVVFDRKAVTSYASSEGVSRSFCSQCGTSLFFEADFLEGMIDITTESMDNPDAVTPTAQIFTKHETKCVKDLSAMARFEELPPMD